MSANARGATRPIGQDRVEANGLRFGLLVVGDGPLALCLHGFPDSAWTWRHLLPELAAHGYRAVAPFMRGYAPTSVAPDGVYQTAALALDANGLHDRLGGDERAVLIGHDWGAAAAYVAANDAPERWRRVVTAAVPPAGAFRAGLRLYGQLRRSWYMFFFQQAGAREVVADHDLEFIERLWNDWSPGYDPTDDLPGAKVCLRDPAHLAAALSYYRAALGDDCRDPALGPLEAKAREPAIQPTLYLHGQDDGCIGVDVAAMAERFLPHEASRVETIESAGHFLHLEKPDVVNALIIDFLVSQSGPS